MAIDQLGNKWRLEFKSGAVWARGRDDDGKECVRFVDIERRELVVDWSKPNALRQLTLTDEPMTIDFLAASNER